jgi:hypothetical protein
MGNGSHSAIVAATRTPIPGVEWVRLEGVYQS